MKATYKYTLAALAALPFLSACDTTDDVYMPGDTKGIHWTIEPTSLAFGAEKGDTDTIKITNSSVKWNIVCTDNNYQFSKLSGEGNGEVIVTVLGNNEGKERLTSSLTIEPVNAEGVLADQPITMTQNIVIFPEELPGLDTSIYPETGDSRSIQILSTIYWEFEDPEDSDKLAELPTGFSISPGETGVGKFNNQTLIFTWEPNYTKEVRSVSLQLAPQSDNYKATYAGKPAAFTLTQAAGTLPSDLSLTHGTPSFEEVEMTLRFNSNAPIDSCGVMLNGRSYRAPLADADARQVTWNIVGLTEGARYTAVPFVVSKVGRANGDEQSFYMDAHVKIPEITATDYVVKTRMVTTNVSFEGDVEVNNVGLIIYESESAEDSVATYTSDKFSKKTGTESMSSDEFLTPNKDYWVRSFIIYTFDGTEHVIYTDRERIHTLAATPGEDDNHPIE